MTTSRMRQLFSTLLDHAARLRYWPRIIPPRDCRRAGKDVGGYVSGGDGELGMCRRWAGLHAGSRLLDVGCGDGRLAAALLPFLDGGSYATFEVQARFVDFLRRRIGLRHPHFSFTHADLWHSYYNPGGKHQTHEYRFPYPDGDFDIVFLNSIFTHFLPREVAHYLGECARVLRKGGSLLATYFLANEEAREYDRKGLIAADLSRGRGGVLNHRGDHCWTRDADVKERIVAIDEDWLRRQYEQAGFEIDRIVWGTWCGRPQDHENSQQDVVVARKR